jgi:hypothetical protein
VEVALADTSLEATINSTQAGSPSTEGTVQVTKPPLEERAVVSITGSVSTGWPVTLSPSTVTVGDEPLATIPFHVAVVVPPATLAETVGNLVISARMTYGGIQCPPGTAEASVVPLAYFEELSGRLSSDRVTVKTAGGATTFSLEVAAKVNTPITLHFEYLAPASATFDGPTTLGATPSDDATIAVNVTLRISSASLREGLYQLWVNVSGTPEAGAPKDGFLAIPLFVEAPPAPSLVDLALPPAALVLVGGVLVFLWRRRHLR